MLLAALVVATPPVRAVAQPVADSLFEWQGYARRSSARISIYGSPDEKRPHAVIVKELAQNTGLSTIEDARYVVEQVGREFRMDPAKVTWFFRWGYYSFADARPSSKELILRATFNRTKTGHLGLPQWRVASFEDLEEATDRLVSRATEKAAR